VNFRPYSNYILIFTIILIAVIARALPGPRTIDDAFITFRYSRNIVEGLGFVYNPGVHTLGTTTPLFTLVMAAISAATGGQDFQWYAIAVSAAADAITAALLFSLTRRFTGSALFGFVIGVLWGVSPRSVTFAVGGMETSVNILWMVAAVWCYVNAIHLRGTENTEKQASKNNSPTSSLLALLASWRLNNPLIWMGVFAGLGLLTRIDAALWIAPLITYQWWEQIRAIVSAKNKGFQPLVQGYFPLQTWLSCTLTIAPWFIFSVFYFGSPIPNSINAKTIAYVMPPSVAFLTLALGTFSVPFFETELFPPELRGMAGIAFMTLYLILSIFGILYAMRKAQRLLPFLAYPWLYLAVFSIVNPLIFRWYVLPPLPALTLGIVCGVWSVLSSVEESIRRGKAPVHPYITTIIITLLGVFWLAGSLNVWTLHPDHGLDRPAPQMAWHQIELYYEQIGTQLREEYNVTPETRVASADIGAVGYFSRATIIDTVGLVTPELRRYYPNPPELIVEGQNYAVPPQLILDTQPTYFVTMEAFVRLGLEQNAAFMSEYVLLEEIPTDFYGTGMHLYGRQQEMQP
jgi:hypothetical protein